MFPALIEKLHRQIAGVKNAIRSSELLRGYYTGTIRVSPRNKVIRDLRSLAPDNTQWRVYDHCAAITRLYSIYEGFVDELLTNWLNTLPDLIPAYSSLSITIREKHRRSVGRLLQELDKTRYQHIAADQVIQGFYHGLFGSSKYDLFPKAFLMRDQNLRKDTLIEMLTSSGISDCWPWLERHRDIRTFLRDVRGNGSTMEAELKALVNYRNEASHGYEPDEVLNAKALLEVADFVEIFCQSLSELVAQHIITHREERGEIRTIGRITECFKNGAVVAVVENASISIGNRVFLNGNSWCKETTVTSIRLNDVNCDSLEIRDSTEVGFMFDIPPKNNLRILQVQS